MNLKDKKKGDKVRFTIGEENIDTVYAGRFDILYLFATEYKTLPKVSTIMNQGTICIINTKLLEKYSFTQEEVQAILYHEIGHVLSGNQKHLSGVEAECDADIYALSRVRGDVLLSALEKTKKLVLNESSTEEKKKKSLEDLNVRCENAKRMVQDKKNNKKEIE